ncbi:NAD(P)H-dependent flavin oxidoreductase [Methylocystis bryophila]|uniref:Nitronate monooxygenase n=1 Tax=Methylocystis bryophila TaxID=655015 RepID=A0A1W6MQH9_9HYPH|nr:nitronate monooxygenase [Methylocystis bryophila]ARN79825.1 2-nitropropane dioxygenase [Methylocystis bryophila]BDV39709.1 2-nitropropane dioxygenase [Methylocystis bryophila]
MAFLPSKLPLIQAPMAGAQGYELTIAVCRAGGLGSLPAAMLSADMLREQISFVRAKTQAPFNVNFFCHLEPAPDPAVEARWRARLAGYYAEAGLDSSRVRAGPARAPFGEEMCAVVEETRPPVVSFHFGLPPPALLARVKASGALVLSTATTVAEGRWLEERGVDGVVVQGREAGGHRGMFLSDDVEAQPALFSLLPQARDALRVPIVAAGGIADGRGVAAAFALGADAVQIGTAFLRAPEASTSSVHRAALASATDSATRLTNVFTGRPARGLVNRLICDLGPMCGDAPPFPLASAALAPLREAAEGQASCDFSPLWAGEATALAREEKAEAITRRIWSEALAVMANLGAAEKVPVNSGLEEASAAGA